MQLASVFFIIIIIILLTDWAIGQHPPLTAGAFSKDSFASEHLRMP